MEESFQAYIFMSFGAASAALSEFSSGLKLWGKVTLSQTSLGQFFRLVVISMVMDESVCHVRLDLTKSAWQALVN